MWGGAVGVGCRSHGAAPCCTVGHHRSQRNQGLSCLMAMQAAPMRRHCRRWCAALWLVLDPAEGASRRWAGAAAQPVYLSLHTLLPDLPRSPVWSAPAPTWVRRLTPKGVPSDGGATCPARRRTPGSHGAFKSTQVVQSTSRAAEPAGCRRCGGGPTAAAGGMAPSRMSPAALLLWLALCVVAQCSVALFGVASRWLQVRGWTCDVHACSLVPVPACSLSTLTPRWVADQSNTSHPGAAAAIGCVSPSLGNPASAGCSGAGCRPGAPRVAALLQARAAAAAAAQHGSRRQPRH